MNAQAVCHMYSNMFILSARWSLRLDKWKYPNPPSQLVRPVRVPMDFPLETSTFHDLIDAQLTITIILLQPENTFLILPAHHDLSQWVVLAVDLFGVVRRWHTTPIFIHQTRAFWCCTSINLFAPFHFGKTLWNRSSFRAWLNRCS